MMGAYENLSPAARRLLEKYGPDEQLYVPPGVDTFAAEQPLQTAPAVPQTTAGANLTPAGQRLAEKYGTPVDWERAGNVAAGVYAGQKANPYTRVFWAPAEMAFKPKTGGVARGLDLLLRDEYALAGATKTALDKWYFGDKTIPWWEVPKQYGRGWAGKNKDLLATLIETPRYGEPLTMFARNMELGAKQPGSLYRQIEAGAAARERGDVDLSGTGGSPRLGQLLATSTTPDGYGRTDTALPPVVHGSTWGILASPYSHLRGPGLTTAGQAAKRHGNMTIGSKLLLNEPIVQGARVGARRAKMLEQTQDVFKRGGVLSDLTGSTLGNVEKGYRAAVRTASGSPVWSGRPGYQFGQNVKDVVRTRPGWARTVDELQQAVSTEGRPLIFGETGEQIKPVMSEADWQKAKSFEKAKITEAEYAGTRAMERFVDSMADVPIPEKEALFEGLHARYYGKPIPEESVRFLSAIDNFWLPEWKKQSQRLGVPLINKPYYPHHGPGKTTEGGLRALLRGLLGKTDEAAPRAVRTAGEVADAGVAAKESPFAQEVLRMVDPDFAKKRKVAGSYKELVEQYPNLRKTHPVLTAAERTRQGTMAEVMLDGLEGIADRFGRRITDMDEVADMLKAGTVPEGHVVVRPRPWAAAQGHNPYEFVRDAAGLKAAADAGEAVHLLPMEMVEFADRFAKVTVAGDLPGIIQHYRNYLGHWKVSQLGLYPGYWTRNFGTEMYWNFLRNPEILTPHYARTASRIMRGKDGFIDTINGPVSYEHIRTHMLPQLQHQGQLAAEAPAQMRRHVVKSPMQKFSTPSVAAMETMAGPIEDFPRLMQGLFELESAGLTFPQAVESVHAFHINYAQLPPFQQRVVKTAFPFSTFPIGAAKIMGREAVRQPHKLAASARANRLVELLASKATGEAPPGPDEIPAWAEAQDPLWIGQDEEGKDRAFPQTNYSPVGILGEMFGYGTGTDPWFAATGPASSLLGLGAGAELEGGIKEGRDYFRARPMLRFPGERTQVLSHSISPKLKSVLLGTIPLGRAVGELERLNPFDVFGTDEKQAVRLTSEGLQRTGPTKPFPTPPQGERLFNYLSGLRTMTWDREESGNRAKSSREDVIEQIGRWAARAEDQHNPELAKYYWDLQQKYIALQ